VGSGFSLAMWKKEGDEARQVNQKLKHQNSELHQEVRKAGQKILDLGN